MPRIDHTLRAEVENLVLTGSALIGKGNASDNGITGNSGANRLYGYEGNDTLDGAGGDDYLLGGEGNDTLTGGAGYDRMYGGIGDDSYIVTDASDYAYENAGEGTDRVIASINHTLRANIEELELAEAPPTCAAMAMPTTTHLSATRAPTCSMAATAMTACAATPATTSFMARMATTSSPADRARTVSTAAPGLTSSSSAMATLPGWPAHRRPDP